MARLIRKVLPWLVLLAILTAVLLYGRDYVRKHPQDVPWTALGLDDPIGRFTLRKLAALADDPAQCRALLAGGELGRNRRAGHDHLARLRFFGRRSARCGERRGGLLSRRGRDPLPGRGGAADMGTAGPPAGRGSAFRAARDADRQRRKLQLPPRQRAQRRAASASMPPPTRSTSLGFSLADGTRISVLEDWPGRGARAAVPARCPGRRLRPVRDRPVARLQRRSRRSSAFRPGGARQERLWPVPLTSRVAAPQHEKGGPRRGPPLRSAMPPKSISDGSRDACSSRTC